MTVIITLLSALVVLGGYGLILSYQIKHDKPEPAASSASA
jgi:hypothetical protein